MQTIVLRGAVVAALLAASTAVLAHHAEGYAVPATPLAGALSGIAHPAIEIGQLVFLIALGVLCSERGGALRAVPAFVAGSALGVALAAVGVLAPVEPLLPLLLLGIAAVLAVRRDGTRMDSAGALGALLLAGAVHGQAAIEPMAGAAIGPFAAYAIGMLATQCAIVAVAGAATRAFTARAARAGRLGRGAAAAAAGLAAIAVAVQPGLSLV